MKLDRCAENYTAVANSPDRSNQPARPRIDSNSVLGTEVARTLGLKLLHLRSAQKVRMVRTDELREHATLDHFLGSLHLFCTDRVVMLEGLGDRPWSPRRTGDSQETFLWCFFPKQRL